MTEHSSTHDIKFRMSWQHTIFTVMIKAHRYEVVQGGPLSGYLNLYREDESRPFVTFPKDVWIYVKGENE